MKEDLEILISPGLWSKRQKIIALGLFVLLLLSAGFVAGTYVTIKAVANVASGFVDEDLIKAAINQYDKQIAYCYPSIFQNDTNKNIGDNNRLSLPDYFRDSGVSFGL